MGGTIGVAIGRTAGGTIGHILGEQMGRMSIELVQIGCTCPFTQLHWHAASAGEDKTALAPIAANNGIATLIVFIIAHPLHW